MSITLPVKIKPLYLVSIGLFYSQGTLAGQWGLEACQQGRVEKTFRSLQDILAEETTIPSHPWEIKMRTALLTSDSKDQMMYVDPTHTIRGSEAGAVAFPVSKTEPYSERALLFSHAKLDEGGFEFYPDVKSGQQISEVYPHPLPHPALMDYYRGLAMMQLREAYKKQKLPWKSWQSIGVDEFGLTNYRNFEVVISYKKSFRGYARFYIGSKRLGAEAEVFGEGDLPSTKLFSAGLAAGEVEPYRLPVERLLKRFGIKENPIDDLREQFPDFLIIEQGRLLLMRDAPVEERAAAKRLLHSSGMEVVREMAPDRDLSKVIVIDSAGPYGQKVYPSELGMTKILQMELKSENMVQDIPDGVEEFGNIPVQLFWVDDPDLAFDEQEPGSEIRDLAIFAAPGDVVERYLLKGGAVRNFPEMDRLPYMIYDSMMDRKVKN